MGVLDFLHNANATMPVPDRPRVFPGARSRTFPEVDDGRAGAGRRARSRIGRPWLLGKTASLPG